MSMTDETILTALDRCSELAVDLPDEARAKIADMVERARGFLADGRREKVMRWLGFMQGVLWSHGVDLETLKRMNMPAGAAYDEGRDR